jgi:hypothetical protein
MLDFCTVDHIDECIVIIRSITIVYILWAFIIQVISQITIYWTVQEEMFLVFNYSHVTQVAQSIVYWSRRPGVSASLNRNQKSPGAQNGDCPSFPSWHAYFDVLLSFNRVLIESIFPMFIFIFYISSVVKKLRKPLGVIFVLKVYN